MTRIQTACYCLIASAFVLTALLFVTALPRFENRAQAEMVIAQNDFTLMTARTRENEESLFVLENNSGLLLVYRIDLGRKRFNLVTIENIARGFSMMSTSTTGGR